MLNILPEKDYNTYQAILPLQFNLSFQNDIAHDDISRTVLEITGGINLNKYIDFTNRNTHGYNGIYMFNTVILAWALFGYASTRKLEELCRTDIRFMFLMNNYRPSHQAFHRFIHDDLKMPIDKIFTEINKYIEQHDTVDTSVLYLDGTKFEANANKMTFVWKKATTKYRARCWEKTMKCIKNLNRYIKNDLELSMIFSVYHEIRLDYLMDVCDWIERYMNGHGIEFKHGKGQRKHKIQRYYDELKDYALKMYKYTLHIDILAERNSFSKTDPDATFMHMKYDYYNNTGVFKPGYNVLMGVSSEYIRHIYISADANDMKTYIPFMDGYYDAYKTYPKIVDADAGYGCYNNYGYNSIHHIEQYLKYPGYEKEKEKKTKKNQFKSFQMKENENGEIICPAGHAFTLVSSRLDHRSMYPKTNQKYVNEHCGDCPLRSRCTKARKGRTLNRSRDMEKYHKEVRKNLESEKGKKIMMQRSIQAEGVFANLKQDYGYTRLRRRGESGVKEEIYLVAIGYNIRKYHNHKQRKKEEKLPKA